ncbi:hypothetical protein P3T76_012174 [Phytophthora citrophthora]|uniref:Uncharacterized protein n=1 Tax=Phytophthora citrophthora TaxID=4793 RepID=A0AAD9G683_9STRA|nr:hypothetical protein P3T76_012174 [Phytophthora citrophthora]
MTAEEQKAFQIQHGEKYIQLKNYTDQLEAELRETKTKMQALTTSNEELREAYKEKSRKCRNWEKMASFRLLYLEGALLSDSSQPSVRQFPSPTRSTMAPMHMQQQEEPHIAQASQFSRPSMRPLARPYPGETPNPSMRNTMLSMGRPKTPRQTQRPNVGIFERFSRPQLGSLRDFAATGSVVKKSDRTTENPASSLPTGWVPLQKQSKHYHQEDSLMAKPMYSPGSAIQRAKPLFELSEVATEVSCKRGKKPPIIVPSSAKPAIPFDSEMILNSSRETRLGHSRSQIGLASLTFELAGLHDFTTETTTDGHTKQGVELQTRSRSDDTVIPFTKDEAVNADVATPFSPLSSRMSISLAPLKTTPHTARKASRSPAVRSSRVVQRYQYTPQFLAPIQIKCLTCMCWQLARLRNPDDLIAEASERRRIADELVQLEDRHRLKQEELSRISKREKEKNVQRGPL